MDRASKISSGDLYKQLFVEDPLGVTCDHHGGMPTLRSERYYEMVENQAPVPGTVLILLLHGGGQTFIAYTSGERSWRPKLAGVS